MPTIAKSWKTERSPFFGMSTLRGATTKDQRYVNMMVERYENKDSGSARFFATKRPGLTPVFTMAAGTGRGVYRWKGNVYCVIGNQVYKEGVAIGSALTTTTGIVQWVETSGIAAVQYLALNDGAFLYVIKTDDTVTKVTDPEYPTTDNLGMVEFFDGYLIVATEDGKIYNSDNEEPTVWRSTAYISAQKYPDKLVGFTRQNDVLLAFGEWTTEQFYDAAVASPASFMGRLDQGTLQVGCAAPDSIVHQEKNVFWVGSSKTGGFTVQMLDGVSNVQRVSTDSIDKVLNAEKTSITSANAYPLRVAGHFYYVLTLSASNRTFVYDIDEDRWTEWQSGSSGRFKYVSSDEHDDGAIVQHESDGTICTFDIDVYQDNGSPIYCILQTAPIDRDTQHNKTCKRFELYGDEQTSSATVDIQYSDDNYKTFSTARTVDMQYRSWLTGLGKYRRRAWKCTHTANTPLRLEGFEEEFQEGAH